MDHAEARMQLARKHLNQARRIKNFAVCQTKVGTVEIKHSDGVYTLTRWGGVNPSTGKFEWPSELAGGPLKFVQPVLAALYVVEG